MPRIFLAGLFHETHSFVDETTGLAEFEIRRGGEMLGCAGDASPLGGVLDFAASEGWEVFPAVDYRAVPGGTVTDEVVETFWEELASAWSSADSVDAIYLVLHGAMVAESTPDVEGEILRRFRSLPGVVGLPLFGVYDLHANFSPAMAEHADCLVAYRENPHADARQAAIRSAELLRRCLETGERPRILLRRPGLIWIPSRTGTANDPMASLEAAARQAESGTVWAVNVAAGFSYADTPDTGVSFQVIGTGNDAEAEAILDQLEALARELDAIEPEIREISPEAAIAALKDEPVPGLTVLVEPSDNIGGGAPGDMTGLLRALVEARIEGAAICLNDPEAVSQLAGLTAGERITLSIGGKHSRLDEGPVELDVVFVSRSDGRFKLEDRQSHLASVSGDRFDMGPSAVVSHRGLTILLTSRKTPPFDLGQWRSQGIEPTELDIIVVKAAVAHRRVYDPIATRMLWVDTPGPCTSRLERLPFRYLEGRPPCSPQVSPGT
ncbi:MAG: M81 family metallopeptidase [Verrucomicrobiae bacterium]|nr:M81 family metallopeptidase [Verrucomicrobiae bacterium]